MTPHRIYILPTRTWTVLVAILAAMWYAAISQNNSAAYLLMFFTGSLVMVSAIHAHYALAGLELRVGRVAPVFAGETARVPLEVLNPTRRPRLALAVAPNGRVFKEGVHLALENVGAGESATAELEVPTEFRGRLPVGRLALTTTYPLGFFRSWRYEPTDAACIVYPVPSGTLPLPSGADMTADIVAGAGMGGDDFSGTRPYQNGESQRHVDWRAVARGQPLLIKQFSGAGSRRLWLEYADAAVLNDPEARLAQLTRWIVESEREGFAYGLRLPGFEAEPERGHTHYHRCLRALALFDETLPGTSADPV